MRARSAGDLGTAEQLYHQVVELDPRHAGALHNLGVIAMLAGSRSRAVEWYERALQARPDAVDTHSNLGVVFKDLGETGRAVHHLTEAIRLRPDYAAAYNNLGAVFMDLDDPNAAYSNFRRAAELDPNDGVAWSNAGRALLMSGALALALEPLQRAVALAPGLPEAHASLGAALYAQGRYPEALRSLERSLALRPGQVEILADVVHMRQRMCDWTGVADNVAEVRRYVATAARCTVSPFYFSVMPGTTALEQRQCAEKYARYQIARTSRQRRSPPFAHSRAARSKLRIGYLHAHFQEHATMHLLAGVLEHHDRARFEITGFQCAPAPKLAIASRARAEFDELVDLHALDDEEAARAIHARGIDILIDGQGYTRGARTGILAHRPAPVQAGYLVYPGTSGGEFLDYYIADRFVIPPDQSVTFSERIKYLPNCYQCNDAARPLGVPPGRGPCGLPENGFVFCALNQNYKITPEIFDAWCRLLRAVPDSVLWLWPSNVHAVENLRREAQTRDVDPDRLVFAQTLPPQQHWARIALADLFLDTFPCNAHTTASDALWAGVPVVTWCGETFVSRVAGSLLHAIGLPELVTTSLADYETLALGLARDPGALSALRRRLIANRATAPLFDTQRSTRDLESVYEEMWREYVEGDQGIPGQ